MKRLLIFIFIGLFNNSIFLNAQELVCDTLTISFISYDEFNKNVPSIDGLDSQLENYEELPNLVLVGDARITVKNNILDTIDFQLNMGIGPLYAVVDLFDFNYNLFRSDTISLLTMVTQNIPIATGLNKEFYCNIKYFINAGINDVFSKNVTRADALFTFHSGLDGFHSGKCYLYHKELKYKAVVLDDMPVGYNILSSYKKDEDIISEGLSLTGLKKDEFVVKSINGGDLFLNIYIVDSLWDVDIENNLVKVSKALMRLNLDTVHTIPVVSTIWRDSIGNQAMGLACGNHIYCDISFLKNKAILHELLHLLLPLKIDGVGGRYLLTESMVEWLTLVLYENEDSISFDVDDIDFSTSLYNIAVNDSQSRALIYKYGVYCFEQLSVLTSKELLIDSIVEFVKKHRDNGISYDQFIKFLSMRMPESTVVAFDKLVKHSSF